ncbi:MAG: hypothetical protein ABFD77_02480 [Thermotogota bacterium]
MREQFLNEREFRGDGPAIIERCAEILEDYAQQGYTLTLRQIYYQLVSHDLFPDDRRWSQVPGTNRWVRDPNGTKNADPNYKWLGELVNKGRMLGILDWDLIEDRARETVTPTHWKHPSEIVKAAAEQFRIDKWEDQPVHVEVMAEKDAVSGILEPVCRSLDVSFTANRGYSSQSFMYRRGKYLQGKLLEGKKVLVVYLGDHDPSGLDMDRDIEERLRLFAGIDGEFADEGTQYAVEDGASFEILRIALTRKQIAHYAPPPNPAKLTDARAKSYVALHGDESWELDALEPKVLADLVKRAVRSVRDEGLWVLAVEREEQMKDKLKAVVNSLGKEQ